MAEQQGSSPMFAIFVLSLLSLALFPYTIYRFCNTGDAEEVVKPWQVLRRIFVLCFDVSSLTCPKTQGLQRGSLV